MIQRRGKSIKIKDTIYMNMKDGHIKFQWHVQPVKEDNNKIRQK